MVFALGLGFLSLLIHLGFLWSWNSGSFSELPSGIHFFGDGMYKWLQLEDFVSSQRPGFTCNYPGKSIDPGYLWWKESKVIAVVQGNCFFLYPIGISFLFSLPYMVAGKWGIFVLQHFLFFLSLFFVAKLSDQFHLHTSDKNKVLILAFCSALFFLAFDLEEHLANSTLFLGTFYFLQVLSNPSLGMLLGLVFGFVFFLRPEMVVFTLLFPWYLVQNKKQSMAFSFGCGVLTTFLVYISFQFFVYGTPLGVKAYDPIHQASLMDRIFSFVLGLTFSYPMVFNGVLFHMPLFFFLFSRPKLQLIQSFYPLLLSIPIFLFLSPPQATLFLGNRFFLFLYPILGILVFSIRRGTSLQKKFIALAFGWSVLLFAMYGLLFFQITKNYYDRFLWIRSFGFSQIIVRDTGALQSLSDLYKSVPFVFVPSDNAVEKVAKHYFTQKIPGKKGILWSDFSPSLSPSSSFFSQGKVISQYGISIFVLDDFSSMEP